MKTISSEFYVQFLVKLVACLSCLILLSGCHLFDSKQEKLEQKKCLVIVKDRSASIVESDSDVEKQKIWIKRYLKEHFSPPMDFVVLDINSSSSSAVNKNELIWEEQKEEQSTDYQSESDQMLSDNKEEMDNVLQLKRNQKKLLKILFDDQSNSGSNQTQIIEIMPQLGRISKAYDKMHLLLLTDAKQESQIRNFSRSYPASKAQAEQFARADFQKVLKSYSLHPNVLRKVESIQVLVPPKTNQETLVTIPYYFEEFFSKFGYTQTIDWASL